MRMTGAIASGAVLLNLTSAGGFGDVDSKSDRGLAEQLDKQQGLDDSLADFLSFFAAIVLTIEVQPETI
jgi:hypothetical protein